ncbi:serine/threonine protein kinase [Archangium lipolyticum]|uniref:serine/threonine protein kinase n=1 Tax=Archangium lipolyticum TaxID=2970465 RepID=UPI00214A0DFD|nr:serine/threonine-protein kinase [Archangium lipolyticum]
MRSGPGKEVVRPGALVGGYRIDSKLGSGGFGKVYLARRDGRLFALKFIHLERVGEWGWRELLILMRHHWPNVVRLLSHFQWPEEATEYLVLVMEYVPGRTLSQWAQEENPCARDIAGKMLTLARVLDKVHAAGVLHRDLKDDNVLVRQGDGEPVLVDFGAGAMSGAPRVTRGVLAPGDLRFRSPESVAFFLSQERRPEECYLYSPADELYALGVIFYALLTASYPIDGDDQVMLGEIVSRRPTEPHEMNGRVPRALSALCMRLLEKEPEARPRTAGVLAEALEAALKEARGDASWDVPLCYGWDANGASTEQEPELVDKSLVPWMRRWVGEKPRRGKRPELVLPPATPVTVSAPGMLWPLAAVRWMDVLASSLKAAVLLGVLLLAGLGVEELMRRLSPAPPAPPITPPGLPGPAFRPPVGFPWEVPSWMAGSGGEVAPPWKRPEADGAAAPLVESTPAAAASPAASGKDTAPVKKQQRQKTNSPQRETQSRSAGAAARNACLGLTGAALQACLSAQQQVPPVRREPPRLECPAGAVETMTRTLGLRIGQVHVADWSDVRGRAVSVREDTPLRLGGALGEKLPHKTVLYGRLYLGEKRVYGLFTEARTPTGETYKVCIRLYEWQGGPGLPFDPGSTPENMVVAPVAAVQVVDHFEE